MILVVTRLRVLTINNLIKSQETFLVYVDLFEKYFFFYLKAERTVRIVRKFFKNTFAWDCVFISEKCRDVENVL